MGFLKTLLNAAKAAFSAFAGLGSDLAAVFEKLWKFIGSVHNLLSWITGNPILKFARTLLENVSVFALTIDAIRAALARLGTWIWRTQVKPVRDQLRRQIAALAAFTAMRFRAVYAVVIHLYRDAIHYTRVAVHAEQLARIRGDQAEHAAMVKSVKAALAAVQKQAASGYNGGLHDRLGTIATLLDDIAAGNPVVKSAVRLLVNGVLDLETIDDPIARWVLSKLLTEIIDKLGVDRAAADLVSRLLGTAAAHPRAAGLYDVARDVSERLNALEQQWAGFMADGGPEVEQAGKEWKSISGLAADAAILGFFGLAVTEPKAWSDGVADTVGIAAGDALTAIVDLISAL